MQPFDDEEKEAEAVVGEIEFNRMTKRIPWKDHAILFRTNIQARPLETALRLLNKSASLRNENYTLEGRNDSDFRTIIILEELLDALSENNLDAHKVLRLHPKNDKADFDKFISEVDQVSEGGDPLEIVIAADLVVGMSSMLLLEAAIMRVPTLAILPLLHEVDWMPNTVSGVTKYVNSRKDLRNVLAGDWDQIGDVARGNNFVIEGALYNFYSLLEKEVGECLV